MRIKISKFLLYDSTASAKVSTTTHNYYCSNSKHLHYSSQVQVFSIFHAYSDLTVTSYCTKALGSLNLFPCIIKVMACITMRMKFKLLLNLDLQTIQKALRSYFDGNRYLRSLTPSVKWRSLLAFAMSDPCLNVNESDLPHRHGLIGHA